MRKQFSLFGSLLQTPEKDIMLSSKRYNQSKGFQSTEKHRNPIFKETSYNTTSKKHRKVFEQFSKESPQHFEINQIISDDFCGCETTLTTCNRITRNYFNNISLGQLKNCYETHPKVSHGVSAATTKIFLNQLPVEYPQIYYTHLKNILEHFQSTQMSSQSFLLLAWVHIHCKFQYVTFFFYCDLKETLKDQQTFFDQLQLTLIKQNLTFKDEVRKFQKMGLSIKSFLISFFESGAASLIPFTQYAKFLEIVKQQGKKAFIKLIALFVSKKREQFYEILKFWTYNEISQLRNYSRYLNWDLFFEQLKSMI